MLDIDVTVPMPKGSSKMDVEYHGMSDPKRKGGNLKRSKNVLYAQTEFGHQKRVYLSFLARDYK